MIFFSKFLFGNRKLFLKLFFNFFYYNPKFHIPKILTLPSTLNSKSGLVNPIIINGFFLLKVEVISVKVEKCIMNVIFFGNFPYIFNPSFCPFC